MELRFSLKVLYSDSVNNIQSRIQDITNENQILLKVLYFVSTHTKNITRHITILVRFSLKVLYFLTDTDKRIETQTYLKTLTSKSYTCVKHRN
jgi:hypothetical protein